ncbi:MAG: VacJ family lipoprotein [Desulfobacterales bacterium]|nr:VacJ family lipoprotein [Desulfobacterales bacterium]
MMKRKFGLGFIFWAVVFLIFSGCAHQKANTTSVPSDPPTAATVSQTRDTSSSKESQSSLEERDDVLDEFESEFEEKAYTVADPLSFWNRAMYHFNDKLYFWFLKPVAKGYKKIIPGVVRTGVRNFFSNILTPIRFTSCILQGKLEAGGTELRRFAVNTTVGILGFGDPAQKHLHLEISDEDLGQTLGSYGIGNGFYLVWPVFGPSTLRDSVGMIGDRFLNPINYVKPVEASVGIGSVERVNDISFNIGVLESIKESAIEPYEAFRDTYIQYRRNKVKQ